MEASHLPQSSPRGSVSSPPVVGPGANDLQAQMQQMYAVISSLQQQVQQNAQQQPASSRPFLPKLRAPSTFSGSMGFAADSWISEMEQQFNYYGAQFPNDAARIHYAAASFEGTARQWWEQHPDRSTTVVWADFVKAIRSRFRPIQGSMLARQRLGRLRMGEKHSIAAYVSVFQATLLHVADMGVTDQIHNFVNGLTKRLQEKVWERQPASLAQAIDFAVSAEAWGNYSHGGSFVPAHRGFVAGGSSAPHSTSAPMDLNNIEIDEFLVEESAPVSSTGLDATTIAALVSSAVEQKLNALNHFGGQRKDRVPGLKSEDIARLMKENRCFRCKQVGHRKGDPKCPGNKSKNE